MQCGQKTMVTRRMSTDKRQREVRDPFLTDAALGRVCHDGKRVRDEVTANLPPMLSSVAWQEFKQANVS